MRESPRKVVIYFAVGEIKICSSITECLLKIYSLSVRDQNPKRYIAESQPPVMSVVIKEKTGVGWWVDSSVYRVFLKD